MTNPLQLMNYKFHDLKNQPIDEDTLEFLRKHVSSYEDLINKRAKKYQELDLKNKTLSENQIKEILLNEYTLLKRPVFIDGDQVFIGNSSNTQSAILDYFDEE
jgi:arsenate reductase